MQVAARKAQSKRFQPSDDEMAGSARACQQQRCASAVVYSFAYVRNYPVTQHRCFDFRPRSAQLLRSIETTTAHVIGLSRSRSTSRTSLENVRQLHTVPHIPGGRSDNVECGSFLSHCAAVAARPPWLASTGQLSGPCANLMISPTSWMPGQCTFRGAQSSSR